MMVKKFFHVVIFWLVLTSAGQAEILLDPSITGLGARLLGMGRAGTAASGEIESFILNPATLINASSLQMTLMYSKLLNRADHYLVATVIPSPYGTFGLGYLRTLVSGPPYVVRDPYTGVITLQDSSSGEAFYDNILYLAYSKEDLLLKSLTLGLNLKLFYKGFVTPASYGSGADADLGLFYRYNRQIGFGFTQKSIFSAMGNKIRWDKGRSETIPNASRMGISYTEYDHSIALDYEFYPGSRKRPAMMLGGEYWISPRLAVRLGMDQAETTGTNLSLGLSYLYFKYRLDFAYHQFDPLSQSTCAFFSFSYGIFEPKEKKGETSQPSPTLRERYIHALRPPDRTLIYKKEAQISGKVLSEVKSLKIEDKSIDISGESFAAEIPLALGKNTVKLNVFDQKEKIIETDQIRLLRLQDFPDVPEGFWSRTPISLLATLDIIEAFPDGNFRPEGRVTKKEMFAILNKAGTVSGNFTGPPSGEALTDPDKEIDRAEAISLIVKSMELPRPKVISPPYPDVPGRYWAISEIISAKESGLLSYIQGKTFAPEQKITRAEICHILSNSPAMSNAISNLLDFEQGY